MRGKDSPKVSGASGPQESLKAVARFGQVSEATVWPIDRLGEGADVPGQGYRWKDWFGKAIGLCGAKTRSGGPCRLPGAGCGGRCKLHGGASTGPRTVEGRARSALNGGANRHEQLKIVPQTDPLTAVDTSEVPGARLATPGSTLAQASANASAEPRRPFLDVMLDAHLRGESRWALAARILLAVEDGTTPLTRAALVASVPEPGADRVVGMLLARGIIVEREQGRRVVLARRTAEPG
jgi:hypothetical protein